LYRFLSELYRLPDNLKVFGTKKTKRPILYPQSAMVSMPEGGEP